MKNTKKKKLQRTIKFILFSISAGIIEIGSFTLFNEVFHLRYWISYLTALILSILWNFTLNRKFTFQSATNIPIAMLKVFGYYCVFTPVTTLLGHWLVDTLSWNEYLVTGLSMAINLVTEYLFDKYVVYRNAMDTNERARRQDIKGLKRTTRR